MNAVITKKRRLILFLCFLLSNYSAFSTKEDAIWQESTIYEEGTTWEQSTDSESDRLSSSQDKSDLFNTESNAPILRGPGGGDPIGGVPNGKLSLEGEIWILISCVCIYLLIKFKRSNLFKRIKNSPSKTKYIEV